MGRLLTTVCACQGHRAVNTRLAQVSAPQQRTPCDVPPPLRLAAAVVGTLVTAALTIGLKALKRTALGRNHRRRPGPCIQEGSRNRVNRREGRRQARYFAKIAGESRPPRSAPCAASTTSPHPLRWPL